MIPSLGVSVWLALGAFRVMRLVGWDDFPLALRVRAWITGQNARNRGRNLYGDGVYYSRPTIAKLVTCPFCAGFWISLAVYVAWLEQPRWTLYALAPFALSAAVGLTAKNLDP